MSSWNPHALKSLAHDAGITSKELAGIIGTSPSTISQWMTKSAPPLDKLIALADFFGVSLDYLCGRCTKEESEQIQADYKSFFKERNSAAYMKYMSMPDKRAIIPPGIEAPWPYNLLEDIFGDPWTEPLTVMQQDGIDYVLGTLTDKEREAILLTYKEGLDMSQIGERWQRTRETVRQILNKGIRKLRHPARKKFIEQGYDKTGREKELQELSLRLDKMKDQLDQMETELNEKEALLHRREQALSSKAAAIGVSDELDRAAAASAMSIDELDLSVRAWNVLARGRITTVGDIIKNADRLSLLRNMGRKTLIEIIEKVDALCGIKIDTTPK